MAVTPVLVSISAHTKSLGGGKRNTLPSELNKTTSTPTQENQANLQPGEEGWRPQEGAVARHPGYLEPQRESKARQLSGFLFLSFFFFPFLFFCFSHSPSSTSPCSNSSLLAPTQPPPGLASHVAQVEVSLLYPPVGRDLLGLVALHVLLHGGEAGAVLRADGALVGRRAVVRPQVLDHG